MTQARRRLCGLLLLFAAVPRLAACAAQYQGQSTAATPAELRSTCGAAAVEGLPIILQRDRQGCGAAALAMIFARWRLPMSQDEILAASASPTEPGIKAGALRDVARAQGLPSYLIHGEIADLEHELESGRPVLVGLTQAWSDALVTHYAVVVGVTRTNDRVVLLDPARGWQQNTLNGFLDEWEPTGRLALVFPHPLPEANPVATFIHSSEVVR